jgi:hypothetical protein
MINERAIRHRYMATKDQLDEPDRRLFVAAEKVAAGYGGTAAVSRTTGVAHSTWRVQERRQRLSRGRLSRSGKGA